MDDFVRCKYCNDIKRWEGDPPLPYPIRFGHEGLEEIHCGYEGAPSPRFRFICPRCSNNGAGVKGEG